MSVEERWEIEDDAGIRLTQQAARPRRRRVIALAALLLGTGLSWLYCSSLPAAPAPTATPAPTTPADQVFDTVHFRVEFPPGVREAARSAAAQYERAYLRLCLDLGCRAGSDNYRDDVYGHSAFPRVLNITLRLRPNAGQSTMIDQGHSVRITLAAGAGAPNHIDPEIERFAYDSLLAPIARIASGGRARWENRNDGELFLSAIVEWERDRLNLRPADRAPLTHSLRSLARLDLPPLAALWSWPIQFPPDSVLLRRIRRQAQSMIDFVDQELGPAQVAALVSAFESARTLPEAIERGLGVEYARFEREWRAWLDRSE